ncbi:MAG: hypothetical protein ACKOOL_02140 [Novosphingobium sp.]
MQYYLNIATRSAITAIAALGLVAPTVTQAEDNSVKRRLDAEGQKYEVDKDGDFKITYTFNEDKRSQIVFVSGQPYEVAGGMQVRNIFAPVAKVAEDNIAGARAVELLKDNNGYKIGAYEIEGSLVLLSIKVPDNASSAQLLKAVQMAASVADEKEKAFSGSRDTY